MMPPQPGLGMMGGAGGPGGDFWQRIMMQRAAQQGGGAPGMGGMPQRQSLPGLPAAGSTGGPIPRQGMQGLAGSSMGMTPNRAAPGMAGNLGTAARDAETYQGAGQRAPQRSMFQQPTQRPMMGQATNQAMPGGGNRLAMLQNRIAAIRGAGAPAGGMAANAMGGGMAGNMGALMSDERSKGNVRAESLKSSYGRL